MDLPFERVFTNIRLLWALNQTVMQVFC